MRICYVCHSDSHFIVPYVEYFSSAGHEVHLISPHPDDLDGVINHHPVKGDFDPMKASIPYLWMIPKVRRMIRDIKPDIVHGHYLSSNGALAALSGFHPLVVTAHGSDVNYSIRHPIKRYVIRYAMKKAELVNVVSRDLEEQVLKLGVPVEKILQLTLGVKTENFAGVSPNRSSGPIRILCTRKLLPVYQCELIVKAAELLKNQGVEFEIVFAAGGPKEEELKRQVQKACLAEKITFLGGYKLKDLPQMLADTDIYVSSSFSDGTSLSLLEAMAAGTFPVVSDIIANRLWLKNERSGLLFDVNSHEQLSDCLVKAINDTELRQRAAKHNRELVIKEGDRNTNMQILSEHYCRLVAAQKN